MKNKNTNSSSNQIQNFGLSVHAQNDMNKILFPDMIRDPKLYIRFMKDPKGVLAEYKIDIPTDMQINAIVPQRNLSHVFMPVEKTNEYLKELGERLAAELGSGTEPYVQVEAQWWGLVFILSDQAAKDLASGQAGLTTVLGAITGVISVLPPPANTLAIIPGVLTAILAAHAALVGLMNRGNGVYITALWPVIHSPIHWIPTPR
ncbi:hypothetical protein [uncultured Roseivirga sp.]|uniref:hypothetical protein n=1 Tax=uncultured Roseivirga sp. TaxID=543088 RepID=UPI0030D97C2D|tara:strand:- start:19172 stop:19783 length:612 start_codon:yes stop_codon:yes gene_type:complete